MRILRLALATFAVAALSACSNTAGPTASTQPGGPSFDGSGMVGSGNRSDSTTVTATTTTDTTATSRGSGMVGSGN